MKKLYRIRWETDVEGLSFQDAVKRALEIMRQRKESRVCLTATEWKLEDMFDPTGEETAVTVRKSYTLMSGRFGCIPDRVEKHSLKQSALQAMDDLRQQCVEEILRHYPEADNDEMFDGEVEGGYIVINPKYAGLCGLDYIEVQEGEDMFPETE